MRMQTFFLIVLMIAVKTAWAQEVQPAKPDSAQRKPAGLQQQAAADTVRKPPATAGEKTDAKEVELDEIAIEAVIEKPNVDIIPKRIKPDFEEMREFERSFARELKSVSKDLLLQDDTIEQPQKVDGLKKIPAKKKD